MPANQNSDIITARSSWFRVSGRILRVCVPVILWTVIVIAAPAFIARIYHSDRAIQEDFAVYYFLALEMRQGINPYSNNVIEQSRLIGLKIHGIAGATDPPTFLVAIMGPLTLLPLHTAYWIWQCLNLACLIAAMYMLIGPGSGLSTWIRITLAGLVVLYPPVASHFWFGQSKFILLLLLVLMMRSMPSRRDALAGSALALATLMRVFPIVMSGYLVLTGKWRALRSAIVALLVGVAITIAFAGWRNCVDFIFAIPSIGNASWNTIQRDIAAQVFIFRQLQALFSHPGLNFDRIRLVVNLVVDLTIVTGTTLATIALPEREDPDSRIFGLWVATAILLLPVAWDYDLVLMLIPFSQLAVVAARGEASRRSIAMAILSYVLLIWWEFIALSQNECGFFSMLSAYLSAYWLAVDQRDSVRVPLRRMPTEILRRLTLAT